MRIYRVLTTAAICLAAAFSTSCYYDAYSAGYSSSYGGVYGGGGTTFIHTSSNRWLYDSSLRCYYDSHRNAYYDPYLNGYYPSGYCPQPITYAPHPYGWDGRGVCPIPRQVNNRYLGRYDNRLELLRSRNYDWARNARFHDSYNNSSWRQQRLEQARNHRFQAPAQPAPHRSAPWQNRFGPGGSAEVYHRQQEQERRRQASPRFNPDPGGQSFDRRVSTPFGNPAFTPPGRGRGFDRPAEASGRFGGGSVPQTRPSQPVSRPMPQPGPQPQVHQPTVDQPRSQPALPPRRNMPTPPQQGGNARANAFMR